MSAAPRASIVMVAWGKREVTEVTLESLQEALGSKLGTEIELVLVDNASPDDTLELFDRWEDRATVLRLPVNRQFAGGCNAGAEVARGDVLLFLNNDMEFPAGTLELLIEQALEPDVGIVGTRLLFPDGTIQHGGVIWRTFKLLGPTPVHLFHFEPGDLPQARAVYDLDAVTGACMAMRRELFEELGGFDEFYVNGLEDIDLCVRVRLAGLRIVYRGDRFLIHLESATRGRDLALAQQNLKRFHHKWRGLFDDDAEAVGRLFGARLGEEGGVAVHYEYAEGAPITVEGHLSALGADAAEGRALLRALEDGGLKPAARDRLPTWVSPELDEAEAALLATASQRVRSPMGATLAVPEGEWSTLPAGRAVIARLASAPRRHEDLGARAIWAATPWLADELVLHGARPDQVAWVPPVIADVTPGRGGDGVLAILPGHDLPVAERILDALGRLEGMRVRAVTNVLTADLERLAAASAPGVELLGALASERELAALARTSDVVVCGDPSDRFQRAGLIAGAAGAAPLVPSPGACSAILGEDVVVPPEGLGDAIAAVDHGLRAVRAATVASRCAPEVVAPQLRGLITAAAPRLSPQELAELPVGRVGVLA